MAAKASKSNPVQQEQITTEEALKLYRSTLNFNVINRYDPAIKQLLCHSSHCVIYKFNDDSQEWVKTDYQGTLALYARDFQVPQQGHQPSYQDLQNLFCYGLILLNRSNPNCFSIGLLPNKISKHFFPTGINNSGYTEMDVELNDNLVIVKNLVGEIYGLWIFNEEDRSKMFKSLQYCLTSDSAF
ncbi:PH domain-like protein [Suhomyces tanzawaensis NRRL Y-17324]|uniref:PH domain-like protein n=1 Tax=Suhomyces tanzawaensis NRRL Y-17324 TaxID=984487 RepID=A0A1E4SBR1_9ASCO|nr:PH domain-like protein [Suhomyces tanzawaensis NRRL Y-17324]ODV76957.1 PH domain-like protein [Suhomyces tanzawaensis NRRL Y-17324]